VELIDALVLKGRKGVGDDTLLRLLKLPHLSDLEVLAEIGCSNLGLTRKPPAALVELLNVNDFEPFRDEVRAQRDMWLDDGYEVVTYGTVNYPRQLEDVEKPPPFLFCKGNLKLLSEHKAVAVVGTRKNTDRGEQIARRTVERFADYGFTIVSGLALGIDSIAHRATLAVNKPTIAVLVDLKKISPSTNQSLSHEILADDGLLVAENPPGTKAIPAFFAKRDRIQAGLSAAVFAIETSIDGGTMHAVRASNAMGRPVYAPDSIAAGYPDLAIDAISGTQHLIANEEAYAYTRESYPHIKARLDEVCGSFQRAMV
jgi:DNA processing protein